CKESYDVAGLPTTRGYPPYKDNIPKVDALSIKRLKEAGVVLFGKTNVPLHLSDFQSYNEIYGTTNNPWDLERIPGGSSGGSAAALAAGLTGFETGSDIGGSIRNPAHFCGVFGHKPTWGLLPPRGHAAPGILAQSDLTVIGPLGRSARDLEAGVNIMAGPDEIQAAGYRLALPPCDKPTLGDFKVAVWTNDELAPVSEETQRRVEATAEIVRNAGGEVDFEARPDIDPSEAHETYSGLLSTIMSSRQPDDTFNALRERAADLDPDDDSPDAQALRRQVATFRDYAQGNERRTHLRWSWHEFFKQYDVMITPMMATPAIPHDHRPMGERTIMVDNDERSYFEQVYWAGMAICSYLPATVVPTGAIGEGLPIGIQIMGPEYSDMKTIGFAKLLEDAGLNFVPPPGY
ncbi:MAG: amidase, partial [Gammaproteobacteria bacterium]|nr:amidase [Gammaproteobacteria bacterium]